MEQEKVSEFLERHTISIDNKNNKGFNVLEACNELYSRIISLQNSIKSIYEALSDYGAAGIDFDKRLLELEGKKTIEIISPDQAKSLLK